MYLNRLHIDGYGLFYDREIRFQPGLNVIYGRNEAGKSTLLAFIRQVLYGFPDGRSSEKKYPALNGGNCGGHIVVCDDQNHEYEITRYDGTRGGNLTLIVPGGAGGTPEDLARLLGRTSKDVFNRVFAFGLDELQTFATLDDQAVSAHIYSAGTGGISVGRVEQMLQSEANELFVPRGRKPEINAMMQEIEEIDGDIKRISEMSSEYRLRVGERDRLDEQIESASQRRKDIDTNIRRVDNLIQAQEVWRDLREAQTELSELPEVDDFPENGVSRLEQLEERILTAEEEKENVESELNDLKRDQNTLTVDTSILSQVEAIEALLTDRKSYEDAHHDLPLVDQERQAVDDEIQEKLRQLGPDWDEARLDAADSSIPAQEEIRGHKERLEHYALEAREAERTLEEAHSRYAELKRQAEDQRNRFEQMDAPDHDTLTTRRQVSRRLQENTQSYRHLQDERSRMEAVGQDFQTQPVVQRRTELPAWGTYVLIVLGLAGGLLLSVLGYTTTGIAVGLLLLIFAGLYGMIRRAVHTDPVSYAPSAWLQKNKVALAALNTDIEDMDRMIREDARLFDMDDIPSPDRVGAISDRIEQDADLLRKKEDHEVQSRKADEQVAGAMESLNAAEKADEQVREQQAGVAQNWADWLASRSLSVDITPDGVLDIFTVVQFARDRMKQRNGFQIRVGQMQTSVNDYENRVRAICEACDRDVPSGNALSVADALHRDLETAREADRKRADMETQIDRCEDDLKRRETQWKKLKDEERTLLEQADATDPDAFRSKAAVFEKRQTLTVQERNARRDLERLVGSGRKLDKAIKALSEAEPGVFERERADLQEDKETLERELVSSIDERGQLRNQIADMERNEEASGLRLDFHTKREHLESLARTWSVRMLAYTLVEEARKYYEQERQPGVITEAERIFTGITESSYTRVQAPLDGNDIFIQTEQGERRDLAGLSRGTAEQLYLALRLGLIREFGRNAEPLPVIMDDTMVNFDTHRAQQTVRTLSEFSENHQVILLTCHEGTEILFRESEEDCFMISLSE